MILKQLSILAFLVPFGADAATRDGAALKALTDMSAYLRKLRSFEVAADTYTDHVADDGEVVTLAHRTTVDVALPDKMRIVVGGDGTTRELVYDGKSFAIYRSLQHVYARAAAPATVDEMVGVLKQRYGIDTPLADLFNWGLDRTALDAITAATAVGVESVAGRRCIHYAFRQPDIDWQIWIREGAAPLPCQFVIASRSDAARPRHSARLTWNVAPSFRAETFAFDAPADAKPIPIQEVRP